MKVKTSELSGRALDWAVAKAEGATDLRYDTVACWWFNLNGEDRVLSRGWSAAQNWAPSVDNFTRDAQRAFSRKVAAYLKEQVLVKDVNQLMEK